MQSITSREDALYKILSIVDACVFSRVDLLVNGFSVEQMALLLKLDKQQIKIASLLTSNFKVITMPEFALESL